MNYLPTLFLASQSPRRKELLGAILKQFTVFVPKQEEPAAPSKINAQNAAKMVRKIAETKAKNAWAELPEKHKKNAFVISADTLVFFKGRVLGKPKNAKDAARMLKSLSGQKHFVVTAVCVLGVKKNGRAVKHSIAMRTDVRFHDLSTDFIRWYVASGEPLDKAGAYGAQALGASLIRSFAGSYTNVVGLPVAETLQLLEKASGLSWRSWC